MIHPFLFTAAGVDKPKGVLLMVSSEAIPKEQSKKVNYHIKKCNQYIIMYTTNNNIW